MPVFALNAHQAAVVIESKVVAFLSPRDQDRAGSSVTTALAGTIVGSSVTATYAAVGPAIQQAFLLPTLAGASVLASALLIPKRPLRGAHLPEEPSVAITPPTAVVH